MAKKLKGLIAIVSVGMLIYLVSSANTSVAEDVEIDAQERFAGATISVEASVVIVELEALEEIAGELDTQALNSIPLDKIMQCIREDKGGEMVSAVKLTVGNKCVAEMNTEENEEEKRKHSEDEAGEHKNRETHISFRVTPWIIDVDKIAVSFDFKQIASESTLISEREAEEQQDRVTKFEVSSELVLRPGQPRIVGATKKDEAIFLIMCVDI
jgi:hypothetical protein